MSPQLWQEGSNVSIIDNLADRWWPPWGHTKESLARLIHPYSQPYSLSLTLFWSLSCRSFLKNKYTLYMPISFYFTKGWALIKGNYVGIGGSIQGHFQGLFFLPFHYMETWKPVSFISIVSRKFNKVLSRWQWYYYIIHIHNSYSLQNRAYWMMVRQFYTFECLNKFPPTSIFIKSGPSRPYRQPLKILLFRSSHRCLFWITGAHLYLVRKN